MRKSSPSDEADEPSARASMWSRVALGSWVAVVVVPVFACSPCCFGCLTNGPCILVGPVVGIPHPNPKIAEYKEYMPLAALAGAIFFLCSVVACHCLWLLHLARSRPVNYGDWRALRLTLVIAGIIVFLHLVAGAAAIYGTLTGPQQPKNGEQKDKMK
jgi:hypothetical protein